MDGNTSLREPTFTGLLAETNNRTTSATATPQAFELHIGKTTKRVTPLTVDAFSAPVRDNLNGNNPVLRKACAALHLRSSDRSSIDADFRLVPTARKRHWENGTSHNEHGAYSRLEVVPLTGI